MLQLNQKTEPKAIYRIVDEDFNILFSYENLTHEVFAKNLMGRWYEDPSQKELQAVAGTKPAKIKLRVLREGLYQFDTRMSSMRKELLKDLLAQGNLMLEIKTKAR